MIQITQKELGKMQHECAAQNLREQQHRHLGKLRVYGSRLLGIAWG